MTNNEIGHEIILTSQELEYLEGLIRTNLRNLVPIANDEYLDYSLDQNALGESILSRIVNSTNASDPGPAIQENPGLPVPGPLVYSQEGVEIF
jgi:hypothetical protein